jgi:hypothetical protein
LNINQFISHTSWLFNFGGNEVWFWNNGGGGGGGGITRLNDVLIINEDLI